MPRPESKTLGYLYDRFIAGDPERVASYENALTNAEVATAIYELRTSADLSQRALADLVGTTASVICRLEDADYEGHSLSMLRRVAAALGHRVTIGFLPIEGPAVAIPAGKTVDPEARKAGAGPGVPVKGLLMPLEEDPPRDVRRGKEPIPPPPPSKPGAFPARAKKQGHPGHAQQPKSVKKRSKS